MNPYFTGLMLAAALAHTACQSPDHSIPGPTFTGQIQASFRSGEPVTDTEIYVYLGSASLHGTAPCEDGTTGSFFALLDSDGGRVTAVETGVWNFEAPSVIPINRTFTGLSWSDHCQSGDVRSPDFDWAARFGTQFDRLDASSVTVRVRTTPENCRAHCVGGEDLCEYLCNGPNYAWLYGEASLPALESEEDSPTLWNALRSLNWETLTTTRLPLGQIAVVIDREMRWSGCRQANNDPAIAASPDRACYD